MALTDIVSSDFAVIDTDFSYTLELVDITVSGDNTITLEASPVTASGDFVFSG